MKPSVTRFYNTTKIVNPHEKNKSVCSVSYAENKPQKSFAQTQEITPPRVNHFNFWPGKDET